MERSDNLGSTIFMFKSNLKGFQTWRTLSGLNYFWLLGILGLSLRSNPRLELANACGVTKTRRYQDRVARPAGAAMESKLNSRLGRCRPTPSACDGGRG